jgi:DNA-binding MarR family transcriptional regulator
MSTYGKPDLVDVSTRCYSGAVTEPRWLSPAQARAWLGYRRMRALLDLQLTRDLARDSGLSEADYDVLSNVSEAAGHSLRLGDLAAHMLWSKSRLSHHVTRMEQRGLVAREDCPSDGRGAVLTLTEAGWQAIRDAAPEHVESVRKHFLDLLTAEQVETLAGISEAVLGHLRGLRDVPGPSHQGRPSQDPDAGDPDGEHPAGSAPARDTA